MSKRKRSQDDYENLSRNSVAQTLARINGASSPADAEAIDGAQDERKDPDNGDDWEVAGSKKNKKRKKILKKKILKKRNTKKRKKSLRKRRHK